MKQFQKAIVIGASSGIGLEICKQLAGTGCAVAALARRGDRLAQLAGASAGKIVATEHDVLDFESIPSVFEEACKALGGLDLVVYAAGVMPEVALHEFSNDKDRAIMDTNLLGAIGWLNQAATRFQSVGAGTILAIGSVAGERGRVGQPAYNASKAGLATYMEALRNRLSRCGVTVVTVKPGPVQTEMTERLELKKAMPADLAAKIILNKASRTGEHFLSPVHRLIFLVIRNIPSFIFRRLKL